MTPPAKKPAKRIPTTRVVQDRAGEWYVERDFHRVRYLLADGSVIDVLVDRDDSDVREALLKATKAEGIAGSVTIPDPAEAQEES